MHKIPIGLAILFIAGTILAVGGSPAQTQQPYAGLQTRAIKALSDSQLADLRAGRGMGLALAAELNGYPGPAHVIELADALALTNDQLDNVRRLQEAMKGEAIALGEQLIQQESDLDRHFADRTITSANLNATTAQIGQTQAQLRAAHLRYHLTMVNVLTPDQVRRYSELRGYASGAKHPSHHPRTHQNSN